MLIWFDDLRISTKLLVVLGIVLGLTVLVGALAALLLDRVSAGARLLANNALPRVRLVSSLRSNALEMRAVQYAHMLSDSEDEQKGLKARIGALTHKLAATRKAYESLIERGFAVVAAEVRSLAQRWANAAKEIKVLIEASVDKAACGARLVVSAGETMDEIVDSVRRVGDIVGQIADAASAQAESVEQINVAVIQLEKMTQQNAAMVEQSAAASESLKDQGSHLRDAVARFRLP